MLQEQEINMANGLFSKFMKVFDTKEYEYHKEFLYFRFNAYGHLLQLKLLKAGSLQKLIEETEDALRQYNEVLNNLGVRGIERFSKEINDKFGFVNDSFCNVSYLYKEKTDAYKNVISRICFQVDGEFLIIKVRADMKKIKISFKKEEVTSQQYIKDFAEAYQSLSVDLYEFHKEIMDILKDENMSHNAIEHLVYTKGIGTINDKVKNSYRREFI